MSAGVWRIRVSAGVDHARTTPGRVVYRTVERRFTGTMTAARAARARLLIEAQQGRYGGTDATVDELLDAWLVELERLHRAPSTIAGYRKEADRHVRPRIGKVKVADVTVRQLTALVDGLSDSGLSPTTVRRVRAGLSSAFSQAARWEWIERDPSKLVRGPEAANRPPKVPTVDEIVALLAAGEASKTPAMARAIWLSATTGIRRGELCALRVGDFDLDAGTVMVERAISDGKVWSTKNRRWRQVGLDPLTVGVVRAQVAALEKAAAGSGARLAGEAYLFSDRPDAAGHWLPDRVSKAFHRLTHECRAEGCEHAGAPPCVTLEHVTFHQLRKFMETQGLHAGFTVAEVAHQAGHDPSMLMRVYAGRVDGSAKKLAGVVASLLAPGQ